MLGALDNAGSPIQDLRVSANFRSFDTFQFLSESLRVLHITVDVHSFAADEHTDDWTHEKVTLNLAVFSDDGASQGSCNDLGVHGHSFIVVKLQALCESNRLHVLQILSTASYVRRLTLKGFWRFS